MSGKTSSATSDNVMGYSNLSVSHPVFTTHLFETKYAIILQIQGQINIDKNHRFLEKKFKTKQKQTKTINMPSDRV